MYSAVDPAAAFDGEQHDRPSPDKSVDVIDAAVGVREAGVVAGRHGNYALRTQFRPPRSPLLWLAIDARSPGHALQVENNAARL
jgi:hypothetical protein